MLETHGRACDSLDRQAVQEVMFETVIVDLIIVAAGSSKMAELRLAPLSTWISLITANGAKIMASVKVALLERMQAECMAEAVDLDVQAPFREPIGYASCAATHSLHAKPWQSMQRKSMKCCEPLEPK